MPPLITIAGVTKRYGGIRPLRVRELSLEPQGRVAVSGLDAPAAEALVHLITGASLPDEGVIRVAGQDTRDIATDTEWLSSLDRFGIVTRRAVLIDSLSIAANLALPLTLAIEPMSGETREAVNRLAGRVGLTLERLDATAATLSPAERVRVHMARALAVDPAMLLLEHPTAEVTDPAERRALGETLRNAVGDALTGWLALTEDQEFVKASASTRLVVVPGTGKITVDGLWRRLISRQQ